MRKTVLNWEVEAMYQSIFRDIPGARRNDFVMERYSLFTQIEDESERSPALSELFESDNDTPNGEYSKINPMDFILYRPRFFLMKVRK